MLEKSECKTSSVNFAIIRPTFDSENERRI